MGTKPELGRTFQPGEDSAQSSSLIVISDRMWRRHLHAVANVIGLTIPFTTGPQTVIGVMPADFEFPSNTVDIWRSYKLDTVQGRGPEIMWGIGRLKTSVSKAQADLELQTLARQFEHAYPLTNTGTSFRMVPVEEFLFGNVQTPLYVLLGAVFFVLLTAAANVVNLKLAQSKSREKEVRIRAALGAGQGPIVQQLLTESVLVSIMGGTIGLAIAGWSLNLFIFIAPASIPRLD